MFELIVSESFYSKIKRVEEEKPPQKRSFLYKLLKQQPVRSLTMAENEELMAHPEKVLNNPSALYILDISPAEALGLQRRYAVNGQRMERCLGIRNRLIK